MDIQEKIKKLDQELQEILIPAITNEDIHILFDYIESREKESYQKVLDLFQEDHDNDVDDIWQQVQDLKENLK